MKTLFFGLLFISLSSFANSDLIGMWKFTSYIYDGQTAPLPNPDLDLRFIFYGNGFSRLRWSRLNEPGFCERKAVYNVVENVLHQKSIWINPLNDRSCSSDSEMRPDAETFTNFQIKDGSLYLELALDGKPFIYVFSFLPDESDPIGNGQ